MSLTALWAANNSCCDYKIYKVEHFFNYACKITKNL